MIYCLCFYYFFLKIFFVPRTWSGCYDQIPEFFYCESLMLSGFILTYQGLLYGSTFIHPSIILRRRLTRFKLPKGFLGLKIVVSRNSSHILECELTRTGVTHFPPHPTPQLYLFIVKRGGGCNSALREIYMQPLIVVIYKDHKENLRSEVIDLHLTSMNSIEKYRKIPIF